MESDCQPGNECVFLGPSRQSSCTCPFSSGPSCPSYPKGFPAPEVVSLSTLPLAPLPLPFPLCPGLLCYAHVSLPQSSAPEGQELHPVGLGVSLTLFMTLPRMKRTECGSVFFVRYSIKGISQARPFGSQGVLGYLSVGET